MVTAIVMAGAGARGAYEAGVLSVVAKLLQDDELIVVGTSAGAINAAVLAGNIDRGVVGAAAATVDVWRSIDPGKVFDFNLLGFTELAAQASGIVALAPFLARIPIHSLLDTDRLRTTVAEGGYVDWSRFASVTKNSPVRSIAVATTTAAPSTSRVFVQGGNLPPDRAPRGLYYTGAELTPAHVLASAAIPMAFPAVEIPGHGWFTDGGVHLNTPIIPALDLGADRIIIIGTHPDPRLPMPDKKVTKQPDIFDAAASIMSAMMVDRVAEDVRSLRRVNSELAAAGLPVAATSRTTRRKRVPHAYFGPPTADLIAHEAGEAFATYNTLEKLLSATAVMGRALGPLNESRKELLSFLLFDPGYLSALVDLGVAHAQAALRDGKLLWQE